ncbi:TetR family transcriptional regulator [Caballeronia udeis]|uniref:TetR family transcriptional regulator n=1 Tax=Caballeronia udeis TaxID=1232866 RepID=A0A158H0W7_9BURK|nr:TetR/AcrR family transcriptional regulator [Caballeronia udeis]SAL37978.1 TetR family transcriptional regulator [Caballeronia udeis]
MRTAITVPETPVPTRSTLNPSSRASLRTTGNTKTRLLDAAETLFIDAGYEAMSMRLITARAEANLAAVNYHFGGKDALIHAMLSRRLDGLNQGRLALLERFQSSLGSHLTCEHILGAMFIPALQQSRCAEKSGPALLRLLGRAYTDPSPFIRGFLRGVYAEVAERFFNAFQTVLPHLPREELGWRLHFCIGSLAGILAGADTDSRIADFAQGQRLEDSQLIGRLALVMVAALKAPLLLPNSVCQFASMFAEHGPVLNNAAPLKTDPSNESRFAHDAASQHANA